METPIKEVQPGRTTRHNNVISMRLDATYFFERGVKFLQRNDLKRALKAFRKTIEYEPMNPVNHCNLAGVLAELGDFEASNEVLLHVLNDIDSSASECQFYLANNYANLGHYDIAEEYVLKYLDAAPEGEFVEDAEEMLGVLMDEFGGGKAYERWEAERAEREVEMAKQDGRHLLEHGHFEAAVEWLEDILAREPENSAALNNLSLAYYYTGQHEKAIDATQRVLSSQNDNIHALCNLTMFTSHLGPANEHAECVHRLKKIFPFHYDHAMKVATTLGLVGEHEAAMKVFLRLAKLVPQPEAILLHSLAASAANAGHFHVARKYWKVLSHDTELSKVALYYLAVLEQATRDGEPRVRVSYQYDMPLQAQFAEMKRRLQDSAPSSWRHDPLLRASLYWGLRNGSTETRKAVIRTLAWIPDEDAERALRLFVKRSDISANLQAAALYVLKRFQVQRDIEVWRDGTLVTIGLKDIPNNILIEVDAHWEAVWHKIEHTLRLWRLPDHVEESQHLWMSYLERSFLRNETRILKEDVWAAAVLYTVLKQSKTPMRQVDVAEQLGVSVSSLRKAVGRLHVRIDEIHETR